MTGTRHRWELIGGSYSSPEQQCRCIKCNLMRFKWADSDAEYRMDDGREWRRFAPPCPPPDDASDA
jgi:hypothetical protein